MQRLMYAYPVAGAVSCARAVQLARRCEFYVRIDTLEAAAQLNDAATQADVTVMYTVILDCGLHRFGLPAAEILPFAKQLQQFSHLEFAGISTHCGHVYAEPDAAKVPDYARQEREAIHRAVEDLRRAGFAVRLVTSGATPTFRDTVADEYINVYHPGNYVFNDRIQLANGTAAEAECALVVYATVISRPRPDLLICDAGAKCLGLDQGAHGNGSIRGFGAVVGHPELTVVGLSEEVGKLRADGPTDLQVGDIIRIIPNHACSAANLASYCVGVRGDEAERLIAVDLRSNATKKGFE
jgi:D-serine deaminase-like pyridoxal phosphate-dependent protein